MLALPIVESPPRVDLVEDAVRLFRAPHRDRDFPKIARVSPLRERPP
jgi:hypothetical protein